jgi:tetratricopeptide (TPR) repeat protein
MSVEPTHNRQEALRANIQETLELIKEYEDSRRLSSDPKEQRNYERQIADLRKLLEGYEAELAESRKVYETEKISLAKLPSTNPELFGRDNELKMLDEVWDNTGTNIISLVAWGGVGKTALVNTWLSKMRQDNLRGAERVFGWSFYSQGAAESKQASADQFIASALKWFGDLEPDAGSAWEKGERLAEFVRNQKTLLILDGLEPLQQPFSEEEGRIRDPCLQSLVRELANYNPGLCVITTRLDVDDLKDFIGTSVENIHLEHLSDEAGMELLKYLGVKGTDDELKQAVRDFDGHALALMLLGTYLSIVYKGNVEKRDRIAKLTKEKKYGGHARQVMESYEIWLKDQPELDILRIMGLFDRPAESGAIEVLRADPPIKGLTTKLTDLSLEDWQFALNNLRKAGLLAKEDPVMPDTLDCHPLIREHFCDELNENNPEAWKEAHNRLYEYFKNQAKEYPDTIEEMSPLYAAVAHGCQAGRYQDAMEEVYWHRIQRGQNFFASKKLGAMGSLLAALPGFFDSPWNQPVTGLTEGYRSFVQSEVGFYLRALGRLKEAAQPLQASLNAAIAQKDWMNGSIRAGNLSELYLTIGDIALALEYANQSVDLADRSGDAFQRMSKRTTLADALYQAGRQSEAESLFREAEEMQKDRQPECPILYSVWGFRYCDLLLSQEKYQEVLSRSEMALQIGLNTSKNLLDIALNDLSLGRAHLLQALQEGSQDFTQAAKLLNQAVDGLRQAGQQYFLPLGLLARAELYRVQAEFDKAQHDIEEAITIAERGEMGLHLADCHLEYARLYLAMEDADMAREHLVIAIKMIEQMGYHRRDHEVKELEAKL